MKPKFDRRALNALLAMGSLSCVSRAPPRPTDPFPRDPASFPASRSSFGFPWYSDQGDGTYHNPVILGDYSDPDVIRVGEEYYLIASSFNCTPGIPILRSRDLVNWTLVGHALQNLPDPRYAEVRHGEGIWAPAIREHQGRFYIFAPTPDEGIYVLSAAHPAGPWSAPRMLLAGEGLIDPCPLWDDDGKAYLVHAYAKSRAGINGRLVVRPMSPDARRVLGEPVVVFEDPLRHPTIEGPKFYKQGGWYYILAPAGGVKYGWQLALRSRSVYGPYDAKTVLQQGTTLVNGPHQGALVDTPLGEWWFVHFQDAGIYGRVVHLNPVRWHRGWPLMGTSAQQHVREPVVRSLKPGGSRQPIAAPANSDEFSGSKLGLQWQWHANHLEEWASLDARQGYLRLYAQPIDGALDFVRVPNLLLQKLPASSFGLETEVELGSGGGGQRAGLIVMGLRHAALSVEPAGEEQRVSLLVDNVALASETVAKGPVRLALAMADGGACRFYFAAADGEWRAFEPEFQAEPGRWIGTKVGLFALTAGTPPAPDHADFAYFRFSARQDLRPAADRGRF